MSHQCSVYPVHCNLLRISARGLCHMILSPSICLRETLTEIYDMSSHEFTISVKLCKMIKERIPALTTLNDTVSFFSAQSLVHPLEYYSLYYASRTMPARPLPRPPAENTNDIQQIPYTSPHLFNEGDSYGQLTVLVCRYSAC